MKLSQKSPDSSSEHKLDITSPDMTQGDLQDDIINSLTDAQFLHRAADIPRKEINCIPKTNKYSNRFQSITSKEFVPANWTWMIQMLVDREAFKQVDLEFESLEASKEFVPLNWAWMIQMLVDVKFESTVATRGWYTALATCIIDCSRRGEHQVIP